MAINFLNNVDYNQNQLFHPTIENQASDALAGVPVDGQLYYNTSATPGLKVGENGAWVFVGGGVESISTVNSNYIDLTDTGTAAVPILTASLNAVDGAAAAGERYLTKNNTWATVASIPGTYTFNVTADTGTPETIQSGDTLKIAGGTYISTAVAATDAVTINHDATSRTDTTTTPAQLAFGGTFSAATSVTTNSTGHVTAINLATYQLPAAPSNPTITLTGDVTGSGTTSIATTISAGAVDFAMLNPTDVITEAEGIENNDNDTTIPTSAAVKAYADSVIVGGLIYQGGYNATTNIPDLTTSPNSILKGWTYTVTVEGTFFGEQLRAGDVLIAEINDPSALGDWTTVQNNIDLASLTQVGIGNVNSSTVQEELGISVSYSSGTAAVGLDINGLSAVTTTEDDSSVAIHDNANGVNKKIELGNLAPVLNSFISFSGTIGNGSATSIRLEDSGSVAPNINHGLGTDSSSFMIQLVNVSSGETVYADVTRGAGGQVTIDFATAPATNDIRVLIQKIG